MSSFIESEHRQIEDGERENADSSPVITEWYGRLEDAKLFPDLEYWLAQDDAVKFSAAWQMVVEAHQIKGEDIRGSRLQRSVGGLQQRTS